MGRRVTARDACAAGLSAAVILAIALACAPPQNSGVVTNPPPSSGGRSVYGCAPDQETAPAGCVAAEYDEFRQRTTLTFRAPAGPVEVRILSLPDNDEGDLRHYVSLDSYSSNGWEYLDCHAVDLLVDGRPFPIGAVEHRGSVLRGASVAEHTTFFLEYAALAHIARASRVRGRICRDVFELDPSQLRTLRAYLERFDRIAARTDAGASRDDDASADAARAGRDAGDGGRWWE